MRPDSPTAAAVPALVPGRRRRRRVARGTAPYLLLAPAGAVIAAVIGYPLY